jgi:hypothetical protein
MPAINEITREKIKGYLEGFIEGVIRDNRARTHQEFTTPNDYLLEKSSKGKLKPFHVAIVPDEFMTLSAFERSFSTKLGSTFENCAYLIALDHHAEAHRSHDIFSEVSRSAVREVEEQISRFHELKEKGADHDQVPNLNEMIDVVLSARDTGETIRKSTRTDLFVRTHDGTEYFFEIKTPLPNKDICYKLTLRILMNHLLRGQARPQVQSYAAMAYNPFGNHRADYKWSVAKMYLPFDQGTIIGDEFWRFIGGESTYLELLEIYAEVGRVKSQDMIESLTQGQ